MQRNLSCSRFVNFVTPSPYLKPRFHNSTLTLVPTNQLQIYLQPWGHVEKPATPFAASNETLLESWVFSYAPQTQISTASMSRSTMARLNPSGVYKRLLVMLRSLVSYTRILPAYRLYRACKIQQGSAFSLTYRLSNTLPFSEGEMACSPRQRGMQSFDFAPVETTTGQFRLMVEYKPAAAVMPVLDSGASSSSTRAPCVVNDYVMSERRPHRMTAANTAADTTPESPGGPPSLQRRSWSASLRNVQISPFVCMGGEPPPSPKYGSSAPQHAVNPAPVLIRTRSSAGSNTSSPSPRPPLPHPKSDSSIRLASSPMSIPIRDGNVSAEFLEDVGTSHSPQLPFAMTPSCTSSFSHYRNPSHSPPTTSTSSVVSGREVSTSSVLMRKPSLVSGSSPGMLTVGYSVSPMPDPMLESVLKRNSSSFPRQMSLGAMLRAGHMSGSSTHSLGVSSSNPKLLTFPASSSSAASMPSQSAPAVGTNTALPFAFLEDEFAKESGAGSQTMRHEDADAAISAFVKLIQETRGSLMEDSAGLSFHEAVQQLKCIRERV